MHIIDSSPVPDFYHQLKHNKLRRAAWHDYRSPCFYLITLSKKASIEVPELSVKG